MPGLVEHFAELKDPRVERSQRHSLLAIVTIALCGVICGAESWVEIEQFGQAKADWFASFLDLPQGIPSHDTFGRVFARLDAQQFEACFPDWMRAVVGVLPAHGLALARHCAGRQDGAPLARASSRQGRAASGQLVSAWASANRLVLAQVALDDKSTEITALPLLVRPLARSACARWRARGRPRAHRRDGLASGRSLSRAWPKRLSTCSREKENQPTRYADGQDTFALARAGALQGGRGGRAPPPGAAPLL